MDDHVTVMGIDEARPLLVPMAVGRVPLEIDKPGLRGAAAPASAIPVPCANGWAGCARLSVWGVQQVAAQLVARDEPQVLCGV